jgi:hypothetical protein
MPAFSDSPQCLLSSEALSFLDEAKVCSLRRYLGPFNISSINHNYNTYLSLENFSSYAAVFVTIK